jgi:hypothetical protein
MRRHPKYKNRSLVNPTQRNKATFIRDPIKLDDKSLLIVHKQDPTQFILRSDTSGLHILFTFHTTSSFIRGKGKTNAYKYISS